MMIVQIGVVALMTEAILDEMAVSLLEIKYQGSALLMSPTRISNLKGRRFH